MSSKKNIFRYLGGLAVAILLPLFFYMMLVLHSKNLIKMPDLYGVDRIDTEHVNGKLEYDTVFHQVADVRLTNQLDQKVSLGHDLDQKVQVICFFATNGADSSAKLTRNMAVLQKAFKKDLKRENSLDTAVQFISITTNPATDSFQALRKYADSYGANHDHWWFLTGNKDTIHNFATKQLFIPNIITDSSGFHTNTIVVLGRDRYIRGYYKGLSVVDMKRCADDIVLLIFENIHKRRK